MKNKLSILFLLIFSLGIAQNSDLKKNINQIIKDKNATVAVSVLDFETNKSLSINGNKKLPLLSVFKFHIALAVLDQVDQGKLSLDQNIPVTKAELYENTYSPFRKEFPDGNAEKTLAQLLRYMVAKSDNNITDILINLIGGTKAVQKKMDKSSVKNFTIKADEAKMHEGWEYLYWNTSTTNSLNDVLQKFYNGKLLSKQSTDFLMQTMLETTTGANKLVAQLPKNIPVAHRTGSSGKNDNGLTAAENDIGIVTLPNGTHYAISILVSDSMESEDTNTKMIADISKIVFDYFSRK
ncbi:class A beta-lactamase, subclass A2 [Kaistella carnis]|uniref:class A beta-lactamase, subclass A2 n=1 Tax=Kaistella carnis TaxID=1241979 RepID=UPI00289CF2F8|nr:class A beta-lactamase, subclass A2 [Kaistella carnis]